MLNNLGDALRISAILYFGPAIVSMLLLALTGNLSGTSRDAGDMALATALLIISGAAILWVAVAWHRYILLDEKPAGLLPEFHGSRILSYFGYGFGIGVISLVVSLVLRIVLTILAIITRSSPIVLILTMVATLFVVLVLNYRLSAILPGAALGRRVTLKAAWKATAGASGGIMVLAIVSALAAVAVDLPGLLLISTGWGALLGQVWSILTGWLKVMVAVSILTTLYGHFIEKRPLPK